MKKLIIVLLCMLFLCSCRDIEDIIPKGDYGSWDGNYIYYKNVRTKTTGEDATFLFNKFIIDDIEFYFDKFLDAKNYKDYIYYVITINSDYVLENGHYLYYQALVRYNLNSKECELFYYESNIHKIVVIKDEYIVLEDYDRHHHIYYDLKTNEVIEINHNIIGELGYYRVEQDALYYSSWEELELKPIMNIPTGYNTYIENLCVDGKDYLMITLRKNESDLRFYSGLSFYSLDEHKLYNIVDVNSNKFLDYSDGYYILGDKKVYDVISDNGGLESTSLVINNELYKVDFNNMTSTKVYTFKSNIEYSRIDLVKDVLRISAKQVNGNKIKETNLYLDINNYKEKLFYIPLNEKTENKVTCGEYYYSLESSEYGAVLGPDYAIYLYQNSIDTNRKVLMQLYLTSEQDRELYNCRCCEALFDAEEIRTGYIPKIEEFIILDR